VGAGGADRLGEGPAGADEHDQPLGAGDRGVEQVALQQREVLRVQGQHHARVLAALGLVNRGSKGQCNFIQVGVIVAH